MKRFLAICLPLFLFACAKKHAPVVQPTASTASTESVESSEEEVCLFAYDYLCADEDALWIHIEDYTDAPLQPLDAVTITHPVYGEIAMKPHPTNVAWWSTEQIDHRTSYEDYEFGFEVHVVFRGERCVAGDKLDSHQASFTGSVLFAKTCDIPAKDSSCSPMCDMEGCKIEPVDFDNPVCQPTSCDVGLLCPAYGLCTWDDDDQDQSGGGCYASTSSCESSFACRRDGSCMADGRCVAATNEGCRNSLLCEVAGRCSFSPQDGCVPKTERDCRQSEECKTLGRCTIGYEVFGADSKETSSYDRLTCVAGCDADCAASDLCKKHGLCWVNEGDRRHCGEKKEDTIGERPHCARVGTPDLYARELVLVQPYFFANDVCSSDARWTFDTDDFIGCYRDLLKRVPNSYGEVRYKATYNSDGETSNAAIAFETGFGDKAFRACVTRSLGAKRGDAFSDCEVDVPLHFYIGN